MPAIVLVILDVLYNAFKTLTQNPFVQKMVIFGFFVGIVGTAITFLVGLVKPYISSFPLSGLACSLGVFTAIQIYITIIIAGWGVKQILSFIRS